MVVKNKWREGALLHLHHPACILALIFILVLPVDFLGNYISVRICIRVRNPHIEECSPLSLPEAASANI